MNGEQETTRKPIVVGVDGSLQSKAALRWAERIATATGGRIEAVIAWDYPMAWEYPVAAGWDPSIDVPQLDPEANRVLQDTLNDVFDGHPPALFKADCRRGSARRVLLKASEGAEMLIVGSRGHGGFSGLLLGSVSAACAEHAHCPVLVVHGETV